MMEGRANKKHILSVLYDVRPVDRLGNLDVEKVKRIKKILDLKKDYQNKKKRIKNKRNLPNREEILRELEDFNKLDNLLAATSQTVFDEFDFVEQKKQIKKKKKAKPQEKVSKIKEKSFSEFKLPQSNQNKLNQKDLFRIEEFYFPEAAQLESDYQEDNFKTELVKTKKRNRFKEIDWRKTVNWLKPGKLPPPKSFFGFILTGFLIALIIPLTGWLGQGLLVKEQVMSNSLSAYQNLLSAKDSLKKIDWKKAEEGFAFAHSDFNQAYQEIKKIGGLTLTILEGLPGENKISSGAHLIRVGEYLTNAGKTLISSLSDLSLINFFDLTKIPKNAELTNYSQDLENSESISLTESIAQNRDELTQALKDVRLAIQESAKVEASVLPKEIQEKASLLKQELPELEKMLVQTINFSGALLSILGEENPRQYLLVFQNNSEIRATGGFIGTYGLVQFDQGNIKRLLIDGVFNADGQLHEKIIPPQPIQKISTAWSMHDANWFADFPTSAQKIQWFYEKTGGVTTDGVVAITPVVIERLLKLTGPIKMPEYGVELNSSNFVELMQYKVEVDYDKRLNRPKKILADFVPLFLNALSDLSLNQKTEALEIIFNSLKEKHLLFYFNHPKLQKMMISQDWAGQLKSTEKDYLSVVSSNINGFKTDRMIDEKIDLASQIQEDGSIINTLTITRQHLGGNEEYDWWNQVNSNYLRVYLPKGSELISARGQTIEDYSPPIDYQEAGFKKDKLVSQIESGLEVDSKTGTHIFEENNKTVFGNWMYVSPGKKAALIYKYRLPFKIDLTKSSNSYSILIQKQAGTLGSEFSYQLNYPDKFKTAWIYPKDIKNEAGQFIYQSDLTVDRFLGITFEN